MGLDMKLIGERERNKSSYKMDDIEAKIDFVRYQFGYWRKEHGFNDFILKKIGYLSDRFHDKIELTLENVEEILKGLTSDEYEYNGNEEQKRDDIKTFEKARDYIKEYDFSYERSVYYTFCY